MLSNEQTLKERRGLAWQETFSALKHYNYRLWFYGQVVSLVGTWMQSTAQGYLIYELTGSPAYLGLVGFVGGLPSWLFTLFGGVIADRLPKRTLLVVTQTSMLVLAFVLAGLTFAGIEQPWHIIVLAFLLGVANAFDAPARVAFVTELVSRESMTNAIALNSTMFNIATVVGPSVAGLTYAAFGPAWCFALNGITYIAVIVALLLMRIPRFEPKPRTTSAFAELSVGVRYVLSNKVIMSLIGSVGLVSVFWIGLLNLLPAWAVDVLHGDVTTNGLLVSARGFGALVAGLMLAYMSGRKMRGKLWMIGIFTMPVFLFAFALIRWLPLSLVTLLVVGWSFMMISNNSNAIVQSQVPDELRGRVMGVYTFIFFGAMPLGALLAGSVAEKIGEPWTVGLGAAALMICALAAWLFLPAVRRQD
jgi:MFS family permease